MKCDVLVVGAGPAGLGAAITSSKKGLKTILVEKSSEIGYPVKSSAFTQEKCEEYLGETFEVAADLLDVPTDEYWEALIDSFILMKESGNLELCLKYLKTDITREEAKKVFPSFEGKYL